ncbi:hypothetical protein KY289_011041 [Solanum tuberosum]|nr:hypothetical protein KY289_011041 [Solanum tuberosum]
MELFKRVEVEILLSDTWMEPKILSIHLRYVVRSRGEKQKEEDGLRRSWKSFPKGRVNYMQCLDLMFLKAYASLTQSHDELRISHGKMKKREKIRDKFFTRM